MLIEYPSGLSVATLDSYVCHIGNGSMVEIVRVGRAHYFPNGNAHEFCEIARARIAKRPRGDNEIDNTIDARHRCMYAHVYD